MNQLVITRHMWSILRDNKLNKNSVVAFFAHAAAEEKT